MLIYLNDRLVPRQEAKVSVFDHGFLYGDGVYETLRAYGGKVFMVKEHIDRLYCSASAIGLDIGKTKSEVFVCVAQTIEANDFSDAYVRITVSRGEGEIGLDPALCPSPTFIIMAKRFEPYAQAMYGKGIKLIIPAIRRNHKASLDPKIKSLNFLNNILAKMEAKQRGADDALMLNPDGLITECTISNMFFYKSGKLCTPSLDCGILEGITRGIVIDIAFESGIEVNEGAFVPEDLFDSDEVFVTNTTMEVMPVCEVDGKPFGRGALSGRFLESYSGKVAKYFEGR